MARRTTTRQAEVQRQFHAAADSLEPRFKANWNRAIREWTADDRYTKAMRLFSKGETTAFEFINSINATIDALPLSIREGISVMASRGANVQRELMGIDRIKQAEAWARHYAVLRTKDLTASSKDAVRTFIVDAINDGVPVKTLASQIADVLALDQRFAKAAGNYRNGLKALDAKPGRADAQTSQYITRAARARAQTIARTETIAALAHGQVNAIRSAMASGLLAVGTELVWIAAPGCCDACTNLNGEKQSATAPLWGGLYDAPPAHPNCRCSIGVAE